MTKLAPSARVYQAIWCLKQINVKHTIKGAACFYAKCLHMHNNIKFLDKNILTRQCSWI